MIDRECVSIFILVKYLKLILRTKFDISVVMADLIFPLI